MSKIKEYFYRKGVLHVSHSKSEHMAAYTTYGSLLALVVFIFLAAIDEFLFGAMFNEYIRIAGGISLAGFIIGCVLIVLSTNKII